MVPGAVRSNHSTQMNLTKGGESCLGTPLIIPNSCQRRKMSPLEDSPPSGHQDKWKGWIPLAGIHYKPDVVLTLHTKMKRINFGWTVFFYVSWDIYYEKAFWLLSSYHFLIHSLGLFQINLCPKTHMRWYTLCSAMFCYNTSRCYLFLFFIFTWHFIQAYELKQIATIYSEVWYIA